MCVWGERMAPGLQSQCSQATYSSSIDAVEQLPYKSVLPKGLQYVSGCIIITPVQDGDWNAHLPTKTEKWKQLSLRPDLQCVIPFALS